MHLQGPNTRRIGVGHGAPTCQFHVKDSGETLMKVESTASAAGIQIKSSARQYMLAANAAGDFSVWDDGSNTGRITVNPNGHVGIGTVAAAARLDIVGGTFRISSSDATETNAERYFQVAAHDSDGVIRINGGPSSTMYFNREVGSPQGFEFWDGTNKKVITANAEARIGIGGNPDDTIMHVQTSDNSRRVIRVGHYGDTANAVMINFNRAGSEAGSIQSAASTTFYATASDARLKGNITASTRGGLDLLRQIKVRDFHFLKNPDRRVQGYIAQELRGLYPEAVADGAQFLAVDYGRLSPLIVAALQQMDGELRAENRRLRARVEALEEEKRGT